MRRIVLALLLAQAAPFGGAHAALLADQPYRIGYHGRLATDVYIDGKGPYNFLIDTASSRTLIFEHVRAGLDLKPSQPSLLTIYSINDIGHAVPVKPGGISVGAETIKGLTLAVLPDTNTQDGPDGILGTDFLSHYLVVLDRSTMRLKLLTPGSASAPDFKGWSRAELTARSLKNFPITFWYLDTRFNDRRLTALFDLGSAMTMLNWQAAEKLGIRQKKFAAFGPPPELLQDVLGKDAPAVRLYGLDVTVGGGQSWKHQAAIIADAPVFNYFDLDEKPAAIVGLNLLGDNSLAIDFAGGHLYVGPAGADISLSTGEPPPPHFL
ncbi:MAG TPA: aspartyl protease family protein [Rhizomicrobium sp.]|nr:aspartyl protease family protein [Rhizomicrobium sp.]